MQTYTHLLMGALAGRIFLPHDDWLGDAALVAGSVGPDIAVMPFWFLAKMKGLVPNKDQGPLERFFSEASHSLPVTLLCLVLVYWMLPLGPTRHFLLFVGFGVLGHIAIDALTHGIFKLGKYSHIERSMMWPWERPHLSKLFAVWDYRYGPGSITPKPFEAVVDIVLFVALVAFF